MSISGTGKNTYLPEQRNLNYLKTTVEIIYDAMKATERDLFEIYPELTPVLPDKIYFIHSEELLKAIS